MAGRSLLISRMPAPLRNQVVERLRDAICQQRFPQGSRLVERQLGELLGVSRTLVREALRQLEAEGFVVSLPHRGPSVASLDRQTVRGIYEVRSVLEALAGELFVVRATEDDRQRVTAAFAAYRKAHDREDLSTDLRATAKFFDAVFVGAKNDIIATTLRPLSGRIYLLRARSMSMPGRHAESRKEMEAIYAALTGSDPAAAWRACREHVERAAVYALRSFDLEAELPPDASQPAAQAPATRAVPVRRRQMSVKG